MKQLLLLKRELSNIASSFDTSRRCIYVDYPLHANIGDLLINLGSEQFFDDHNLHVWKRYNQYDFPGHIKGVREDDVFLLHGGGNLGDLWEPYQSFRESILERYPNNRIIFLPQTVHFQSRTREQESMRKMSGHRNLHIFARDYVSLKRLQAAGLECVSMAPDMAHSLIGVLKPTSEPEANSELHLIRADKEGSQPPVEFHTGESQTIDWERGTIAPVRRLMHPHVLKVVKGIGRYMRPLDAHGLWYWHRNGMIHDGIKLLSRHETVVTNRLHAILLGLLLGRKVRAWDNSYGKLSAYYDAWLSDIPGLTFYQEANRKAGTLQNSVATVLGV